MDDVYAWRAARRRVLDEEAANFAGMTAAQKLDLMLKLVNVWFLIRGKDQSSFKGRRYQLRVGPDDSRTVECAEFSIAENKYTVEEDGRIFQTFPRHKVTSNWNILYDD
jgi:hypothetical protein